MNEQELAKALRRLHDVTAPPPVDPAREAALMAAFDAASGASSAQRRPTTHGYWPMAGLAAAAAVLIAIALPWGAAGRRAAVPPSPPRDVQPEPSAFVVVPGAASLPFMESGSLVRVDLPVSVLPSLGLTPPAGGAAMVRADLVVGQDGLTRAVRLVN
ncbi:MAG TPA: hypothetical protein VH138_02915 [Vicinamibacterales bacterium]|nr:hypothetical protein [Vicinamibacterales bacterium]